MSVGDGKCPLENTHENTHKNTHYQPPHDACKKTHGLSNFPHSIEGKIVFIRVPEDTLSITRWLQDFGLMRYESDTQSRSLSFPFSWDGPDIHEVATCNYH